MRSTMMDLWREHQAEEAPDVQVLSDRTVRARVPHTCQGCEGVILVGEQYRRTVLVVDGDLTTEKVHADHTVCRTVRHNRRFY